MQHMVMDNSVDCVALLSNPQERNVLNGLENRRFSQSPEKGFETKCGLIILWIILAIMLRKTRIIQTEKPDDCVTIASGFSVILCISLIIILLTASASAFNIALEGPDPLIVGDNLTVIIEAGYTYSYDVKIVIQENKSIVSEIYSAEWKSPFYYIKGAYPSQPAFTIRATRAAANATLCVRLRKTNTTSYREQCMPIVLAPSELLSNLTIPSSRSSKSGLSQSNFSSLPTDNQQRPSRVELNNTSLIAQEVAVVPIFQNSTSASSEEYLPPRIVLVPPLQAQKFVTNEEYLRRAISYITFIMIGGIIIFWLFRKMSRNL